MASVVHALSLSNSDIGNFIGPRGSSLRKFVINASVRDAKSASITDHKMNIRVSPGDGDTAKAEIRACSSEMCDIVVVNLDKHLAAFLRKKSAPPKPKVVKIVYKTAMEEHHQGKYVGYGGKNIKRVLHDCTEAIAAATDGAASSIRVNISDDRFLHKGSYYKLFTIRNNAKTENQVLISVSCIYDGPPGKIFSATKPIIIDSVVNMFPPAPDEIESAEVDFLGGGSFSVNYTTNSSPTPSLGGMEDIPEENAITAPDSPGYCPPSPTPKSPEYSPSSPTYTPPQ